MWLAGRVVRPRIGRLIVAFAASAALAACDSSVRRTPTQPIVSNGPLPNVQLTMAPMPLQPVVLGVTADGVRVRVSATLTFTEKAGGSGRLVSLSSTVVVRAADWGLQAGTITTLPNFPIAPFQSASTSEVEEFVVPPGAESVSWRVSASGLDAQGRPFNVAPVELPIVIP